MFSKRFLIPVSVLLMAAASVPAAEAGTGDLSGSCSKIGHIDFRSSIDSASATSTSFVDLPNGSVDFLAGTSVPGCVFVQLSATMKTRTAGVSGVWLRVMLDNMQSAWPGDAIWTSNLPANSTSFEFVFPSVNPGRHTVSIRWASYNGKGVDMVARTLSVAHR